MTRASTTATPQSLASVSSPFTSATSPRRTPADDGFSLTGARRDPNGDVPISELRWLPVGRDIRRRLTDHLDAHIAAIRSFGSTS